MIPRSWYAMEFFTFSWEASLSVTSVRDNKAFVSADRLVGRFKSGNPLFLIWGLLVW